MVATGSKVRVSAVAHSGGLEGVLKAAGADEDVWVVRVVVALALYVQLPEFDGRVQLRGAVPLRVGSVRPDVHAVDGARGMDTTRPTPGCRTDATTAVRPTCTSTSSGNRPGVRGWALRAGSYGLGAGAES